MLDGNAIDEGRDGGVPPACAVCVVTYNSQEIIGRLLRSIANEPIATHIRILDNASKDESVRIISELGRELDLDLTIEVAQTNLGFSVGCNELLTRCEEPLVAVVNPDVEFTPGSLERLVEVASAERSIGIVACRLMTRQGRSQTAPARPRPRLRHLVLRDTSRRIQKLIWRGATDPLTIDRDVECMTGALMVFRRELIDRVGFLDESVFMYLEDIDYAARTRRAGYRIRYLGTTWAWHDCGGSTPRHEPRIYALLPRVWVTYMARYGSRLERVIVRPFIVLLATATAVRRIAEHESVAGQIAAIWGAISYRAVITPVGPESRSASPVAMGSCAEDRHILEEAIRR